MRLTLRTLLAYLDNTLDEKDAELLRQKLSESGFATQLVQRIRTTLVNPKLSAPSPDAVSPVDEANVISEYLDSTLTTEQIAEVEKACLESDPHLAEAAACHQILTMVLGKPADVSEALRDRIYRLPDRSISDIPTAVPGSFSGVSVPDVDDLSGIGADPAGSALPSDDSMLPSPAGPVTPVGAGDSGVSDAPRRLQQAAAEGESDSLRRARVAAEDMYGGSIRTSRITPWLVSLALAGVFLFVLAQVLAPLIGGSGVSEEEEKIAKLDTTIPIDDPPSELKGTDDESELESAGDDVTGENASSDADDIVVPAGQAPPMETVGSPGVEIKSSDEVAIETLPLPAPSVAESETPKSSGPGSSGPGADMPAPKVSETGSDLPKVNADTGSSDPDDATSSVGPPPAAEMAAVDASDSAATDDLAAPKVGVSDGDPKSPDSGDAVAVAKAISENTVLIAASATSESLSNARLTLVQKDMAISQRATLVNAPKFRSELVINTDVAVTLVEATRVRFIEAESDQQTAGLHIDYGRVIVKSKRDDVKMPLQIAGREVELRLPTADTTVAIEVRWIRRAGFDPFTPDNHSPIARVVAVADANGNAGEVIVSSAEGDDPLAANQQWLARGDDAAKIMDLLESLDWVTAGDGDSILDESAREGLLALVAQTQPVSLTLREATSFRRAEVAALAAQLMLNLGRSDVYFGTDGILSDAKQRVYWTDHFHSLRSAIDRSDEVARMLNDQIGQMDAANVRNLMRLLVGFSQSQLVEGADEELIGMLDSNSMAVRVLATENLREITGTTLNFWAGEDNAVRRVSTIKKWQVRMRKGDIRWKADGLN